MLNSIFQKSLINKLNIKLKNSKVFIIFIIYKTLYSLFSEKTKHLKLILSNLVSHYLKHFIALTVFKNKLYNLSACEFQKDSKSPI